MKGAFLCCFVERFQDPVPTAFTAPPWMKKLFCVPKKALCPCIKPAANLSTTPAKEFP